MATQAAAMWHLAATGDSHRQRVTQVAAAWYAPERQAANGGQRSMQAEATWHAANGRRQSHTVAATRYAPLHER